MAQIKENSFQYAFSFRFQVYPSNGKKPIDISDNLKMMTLDIDLKNLFFPIIKAKFKMYPKDIVNIQNDENVRYYLKIISTKANTTNPEVYDTFMEIFLKPLINTDTPLNLSDKVLVQDSGNYQTENFEVTLIPEECLKANKKLASGVYKNVTLYELVNLLGQKCENPITVEPFDNQQRYNQIVLLPYNVFANISYLENTYGFYKTGCKMFYGFNQFKINSNKFTDSSRNNVYVNFPVNDKEHTYHSNTSCSRSNNGDLVIQCSVFNINVVNNKLANNEIVGNNFIFFDELNNYSRKSSGEDSKINTRKKTRTYTNRYNNKMIESEIVNKVNNGKVIQLSFDSIDFRITDIFKKFGFFFKNSIYSERFDGEYSLSKMRYNFSKTQGSTLSVNGVALFTEI